jgi:DNA-binding transcriptional ArsR family regulator
MSRASAGVAARVRDAAPLFAALGDETRLRLVLQLSAAGPVSVARLAENAAVSRQAIAKHLDVLSGAGLARGSRRGRERVWELEPARLAEARAYLDRISAQWDEALGRLKALVESDGDPGE